MPERVPIEVLSTEAGWSLLSVLDEEYGELTEDEQRAVAQTVLDREDLWVLNRTPSGTRFQPRRSAHTTEHV